ncbi:MAG: hypothetical protein WBQ09_09125 [Terriglobales bacterium]|jgi:hypothetical protein
MNRSLAAAGSRAQMPEGQPGPHISSHAQGDGYPVTPLAIACISGVLASQGQTT